MNDVFICIVIYGYKNILSNCVESLLDDVSSKVICVINNYQYKSFENENRAKNQVESLNEKIIYIQNDYNSGYSKAANKVYREYFNNNKAKFYIIMNDDVVISKNSIYLLLNKFYDGVGLIGPHIKNNEKDDGPYRFFSIERRITSLLFYPFIKLFNKEYFNDQIYSNEFPYRLNGCFLMFNAKAFLDIGLMDENVFLFSEELIISEKLNTSNYSLLYCNDIFVQHLHSLSINEKFKLIEREKVKYKSLIYYYDAYMKVSKTRIILAKLSIIIYLNCYLKFLNLYKRMIG